MALPIKPALTSSQWAVRRAGIVAVEAVQGKMQVAVRAPDGDVVSVAGDDEIVILVALGNDALGEHDQRKLSRKDLAVLSVLIDEYRNIKQGDRQILTLATNLYEKLAALLPSPPQTPPQGIEKQTSGA